VRHWNPFIKCRESPAERGRRVTLYDHAIRPLSIHHRFKRGQNPRRRLRQRLPRLHHIQIVIGHNRKRPQHLVEHRAMLGRHRNARVKARILPQTSNDRSKLDRLRTRAEDEEYFQFYLWRYVMRPLVKS